MATQAIQIQAMVGGQEPVGDLVPSRDAPLPQQPAVTAKFRLHQCAGDSHAPDWIVHRLVLLLAEHDLAAGLSQQAAAKTAA